MKRSIAALILVLCAIVANAQGVIPARPIMAAYDDESAISREGYRESPYFMELSGSWRQRQTDSSIIYTKQLDVERTWKDYLVYLSVRCGHACRVSVGGKVVGVGDDSRQWNEFLLSPYLKYGKQNVLTIEALKNPVGALLEDKEISVGLNGEPYLLFKNDPNVADFTVLADYDAALEAGSLTIDATILNTRRKGRYYLEVEVLDPKGRQMDRMGRWVIFEKNSEERIDLTRSWPGVEPWSADQPSLYTVVVRLRNEKMEEEEVLGTRFGFRRAEISEGRLLVNGKPVTLRGVAYGEEHAEGNISRQRMEKTVKTMKENGVNAVRTTRFSPMDPFFYSLCDRYGLYVVADANILPTSTGHRAVATEKDMIPLFEQRVEHLYGSFKNYTSIIAWSLGNTRDNGLCMTAAYKRLKVLDKSRPVLFAGAQLGESTDIIFLDYPTTTDMRQALGKADRPVLMARSVDAPRFASLGELWHMVESSQRLQGGFLDAWPLSSDMLDDLRNLYSPFSVSPIRIGGGEGEFRVVNNSDFANFSRYRLEYTIYTNLRPNIISGELALAVRAGESEKVGMRVPQLDLLPGEEPYIRFDISRRPEGRTPTMPVSLTVFPLEMRKAPSPDYVNYGGPLTCEEDSVGVLHISSSAIKAMYSKGTLKIYGGDSTKPIAVPTFSPYKAGWSKEVLASNYRIIDEGTICIDAMVRYIANDGPPLCDVRETYAIYSSGDVTIDYTVRNIAGGRAKVQPAVRALRWQNNQMLEWYGNPRETIIEGGNWRVLGVNKKKADEIGYGEEYKEVRWCLLKDTLTGDGAMAWLEGAPFVMLQHPFGLTLEPNAKNGDDQHYRLVIKMWNQSMDSVAMLSEASVTCYPEVSSGIPEPPVIKADASRFAQPLKVALSASAAGDIHYTTDGSEPTTESPLYKEPIVITASTLVKARLYAPGLPPSFTASRQFNFDYIRSTSFSRRPNTPYNVGTDTILFDGIQGTIDNLSHGWLGFSGGDVQTTVELAKPVEVGSVMLRFAHNPATWAFSPREVLLTLTSSDGTVDTVRATPRFDPSDAEQKDPRVVELQVDVPTGHKVTAIRIDARTIGAIPAWHRGKGLNPWLLMDEIEVVEKL